MRYQHFEYFSPICPFCYQHSQRFFPLDLHVFKGNMEWIEEGNFVCNQCTGIFPIIRGIPILVPNVAQFMQNSFVHTMWNTEFSPHHMQWISEAAGPTSLVEATRSYLSTYMHSHYADKDPQASNKANQICALLNNTKNDTPIPENARFLDVGCSVGRSSFWLAEQYNRPVLGVDINFAMLLHAQDALRNNRVAYGLREVGCVYKWQEYSVEFPNSPLVDFWVADATCLPFAPQSIHSATSLHVLDCTTSPIEYLCELTRVSKEWNSFCPYDWSTNVTEFTQWLGGHGSFSQWKGKPENILHYLLSPNSPNEVLQKAQIVKEEHGLPWDVRLHNRATMRYDVHYIQAKVTV